jgi:hypothetical protein
MRDVYAQLTPQELAGEAERQKLAREVPELRARTFEQFASGLKMLTEAFSERLGRPPDDLQVRVIAGAIIGVGLAAILTDEVGRMDEYFAQLERGL